MLHPSVRASLITLGYRTSGYPAENGTPVDLCYLDDEKQPQGYFKAQNEAFLQVAAVIFPLVFLLKLPLLQTLFCPSRRTTDAHGSTPRFCHCVVFMHRLTFIFVNSQTIKSPSWPPFDLVCRFFFPTESTRGTLSGSTRKLPCTTARISR